MKKVMGIYRFFNIKTLKGYIGSSRDTHARQRGHINKLNRGKHHSFLLQRSWNKHGVDAFVFEILEIVSDISKLKEREQYWIDYYDAANPDNPDKGYNRCPIAGTTKNLIPTPETIEKLRISHLGHKPSPETIEKQRQAMLGKTYPFKPRPWRLKQETRICICGCGEIFVTVHNDPKQFLNPKHRDKARRKLRDIRTCLCGCQETFEVICTSPKRYIHSHANKNRWTSDNPHPMLGKTHTEEVIEKIRKVHLGKKQSLETRRKRSEKMKIAMLGNTNGFKKKI